MCPLVSICIPAYNHAAYVGDCIRSIIAQDYPNIELILIDDGSTDGTWAQANALRASCEARFVRVVFRSRENRGRVATFRELISEARGMYVGEIASDDRYLPTAVSRLVAVLEANPDAGLAVGRNLLIDSHGRRCYWDWQRNAVYDLSGACYCSFDDWFESRANVRLSGPEFGTYARLLSGNHVPNGYIRRMSDLRRIRVYDEEAPLEDWWTHLQLSKVARFVYVQEDLFEYRWHGANSVANPRAIWAAERQTLLREERLSGIRVKSLRALMLKYLPFGARLVLHRIKSFLVRGGRDR